MSSPDYKDKLMQLLQRARATNKRSDEKRDGEALVEELKPEVVAIVNDTLEFLSQALHDYDVAEGTERHSIADPAFVATIELKGLHGELERINAEVAPHEIVSRCARVMGCVSRAVINMEIAISKKENVPSALESLKGVPLSLETRRTYAKFRRGVFEHGELVWPASIEEVRKRLRLAGTGIAKLRGYEVYTHLRFADRLQFQQLQERLLAWLREGEAARAREGMYIWEDIAAFAELLMQVNNRQELREHDTHLIDEAHWLLASMTDPLIPEELHTRLVQLEGRSLVVDQLILENNRRCEAWSTALEGLLLSTEEPPSVVQEEAWFTESQAPWMK